MKATNRTILKLVLILFCSVIFGQVKDFQYKRLLSGSTSIWNRIVIPDELYSKLKSDLSDIRIIGITKEGDTIEAPYLLNEMSEKSSLTTVNFKILNQSSQTDQYYYTFEVPSLDVVNRITLNFEESNFDRLVKLEGSNDQSGWFLILDNYRIISINNAFADYNFTVLNFNDSKYRYYRLSFKSKLKPELTEASISEQKILQGSYRSYELQKMEIAHEKDRHETIITGELPGIVPVSYLKIEVQDKYDFYRPVYIQCLVDSVESPTGWNLNYLTVASGVLSSLEFNEYIIPNRFMQKLKIIIVNNDNEPLNINKVIVKGNLYELIIRMVKPATYYLVYNNSKAQKPLYDLGSFKEKIPEQFNTLSIGPEQLISHSTLQEVKPIFEKKIWLWLIMTVIIILLGGFTYKMLRSK